MQGAVIAANPLLQIVDRGLARFADVIVANSSYTAERIEHIYRRRASVAPPGVDPTRFRPGDEKEPLVLSVGRLTRFKRFDIILRAAAALKQDGIRARWVIAGGGEEQDALRSLARSLSVADCVEFTGRVDEQTLNDYFSRAAIVAVTSINEPFGIVPVEGMAAGAAVICSDSGGPARTVLDGITGLHFRSGDSTDFARSVAYLLQHPELAREMGARGRQIALSEFTWERTTAFINQAIVSALSAPRHNASCSAC
jgi:glycosyltransferase involved in cell wall biosynthesis